MVQRIKPTGQEWDAFAEAWAKANHAEKLSMAKQYKVSYDTAKHWISDSGCAKVEPTDCPPMTITTEELLNMRPSVNLDFVSFDLETSNLTANFSVLLSACIKPFGQEPVVFRADDYKEWITNRANDFRIVVAIAEELRKHAIVITHYGTRFDIRYLRAKMVKYGIPPLPPMFGVDTWDISRKNFKLSSNRLATLVEFFDLGHKSGVDGELWMKAAYSGDKESMDEIIAHNVTDVLVLEKLGCITFPFIKSIPKL
jgi:uncharacterized protein YprB with RNaseH-like and TPR domain